MVASSSYYLGASLLHYVSHGIVVWWSLLHGSWRCTLQSSCDLQYHHDHQLKYHGIIAITFMQCMESLQSFAMAHGINEIAFTTLVIIVIAVTTCGTITITFAARGILAIDITNCRSLHMLLWIAESLQVLLQLAASLQLLLQLAASIAITFANPGVLAVAF